MRKKIISIIGARPQFIKHAPVSVELEKQFHSISIHTGQHYDDNMSSIFFSELKIKRPDYNLDLDKAPRHGVQTGIMLHQIEEILIKESPNAILVYGDTNSTLAGALAASKLHIPIIHVEAGLRSFNREMPEEINRVLVDHLSTLLFVSTPIAEQNLLMEGIKKGVHFVGDVMCDSLHMVKSFLRRKYRYPYFFATIHRPYNTDEKYRLKRILNILNSLPNKVIFSLHPRTANHLKTWDVELSQFQNIDFIEPVGYQDCLSLQAFAECVITDSGGMQKEAYMLHKKCITIRKETEWVETLKGGCNSLVFENLEDIYELITSKSESQFEDLYGDGKASKNIVDIIKKTIK